MVGLEDSLLFWASFRQPNISSGTSQKLLPVTCYRKELLSNEDYKMHPEQFVTEKDETFWEDGIMKLWKKKKGKMQKIMGNMFLDKDNFFWKKSYF